MEWFRFTLLLSGVPERATAILREIFSAAKARVAQRSPEEQRQWLVRQIRDRVEQLPSPPASATVPRFAALPEPARSAYALYLTLTEDEEVIAALLDLRPEAVALALDKARESLAASPETSGAEVDREWRETVAGYELPAELGAVDEAVEADEPTLDLRALLRQPAVLAIGIALLVVIGVLVVFAVHDRNHFAGKEWVTRLFDDSIGGAGAELEAIEPEATGRLADRFLLKGFDNFVVPKELEEAVAIGCQVSRFKDRPVAQVALEQRDSVLLVFHETSPRETAVSEHWHFFQHGDWAVAVRGTEKNGYVIAYPGDVDEMGLFLHQLNYPEGAAAPKKVTPSEGVDAEGASEESGDGE